MVPSDRVLSLAISISVLPSLKYQNAVNLSLVVLCATQVNVRLPPSNVVTFSFGHSEKFGVAAGAIFNDIFIRSHSYHTLSHTCI